MDLAKGGVNPRLPNVAMKYGSVDRAVAMMTRDRFLYVADLQDAFFNWRVHPESSMELGFYAARRKQFDKFDFVPFSLGPSPG